MRVESMQYLLQCPAEIVRLICSNLSCLDLYSVRLTCRQLCDDVTAIPEFMSVLYIGTLSVEWLAPNSNLAGIPHMSRLEYVRIGMILSSKWCHDSSFAIVGYISPRTVDDSHLFPELDEYSGLLKSGNLCEGFSDKRLDRLDFVSCEKLSKLGNKSNRIYAYARFSRFTIPDIKTVSSIIANDPAMAAAWAKYSAL